MADQVDLSPNALVRSVGVARAIQYAAGVDGWVLPTDHTHNDLGTAFGAATSGSSLDVPIDGGIAFVKGKHCRTDTQTTVTLAASTADQTVYVGWPEATGDNVIVGRASAFPTDHEKLPLWTFGTDGTGVTASTDERVLEYPGADLGDGTEIGRALFTALTATAQGTPGDSANEIFRVPGGDSDLILSTEVDGRMHLTYNAYYDGAAWRFITGGFGAARLTFRDPGDIKFFSSQAGSPDATIDWHAFDLATNGDVRVYPDGADGTPRLLYDRSSDVVPRARLPLPWTATDLDDGPGSGIDADTVDGFHGGDIGDWTHIVTFNDSNTSTVSDFNSGNISPTFDIYRLIFTLENNSGQNDFLMRVNGFQAGYFQISYNNAGFISRASQPQWQDIAPVNGATVSHAVVYTSGPVNKAETNERTVSAQSTGQAAEYALMNGNHSPDLAGQINNFHVWTSNPCAAAVRIDGQDL